MNMGSDTQTDCRGNLRCKVSCCTKCLCDCPEAGETSKCVCYGMGRRCGTPTRLPQPECESEIHMYTNAVSLFGCTVRVLDCFESRRRSFLFYSMFTHTHINGLTMPSPHLARNSVYDFPKYIYLCFPEIVNCDLCMFANFDSYMWFSTQGNHHE